MGASGPKANIMTVGLGGLLRAHHDHLAREELPSKWLELMNCADESERKRLKSELAANRSGVEELLPATRDRH